jgi:hypothetical protein
MEAGGGAKPQEPVRERRVFTLEGRTFAWGDVLEAARARGDWEELVQATRAGLACLQRLIGSGEEPDEQALDEAGARFRYARGLLAGEEMEEWLRARRLRVSEWRDYLRRALLRERWAGELAETAARYPVAEADVEAALWAEAACSGSLERWARQLAGEAALAALADEREAPLERLLAAADRLRATLVTEEEVEREVAAHALEWLRVEGQVLAVVTEDAAREVALCVREDGRPLAEVAAEAGSDPQRLSVYLCDVESGLGAILLAAREGELLGPLPQDGAFALVLVERKQQPDASDPEVRRKASERLVSRALERAVAERVEWHEHL